MVIKSLELKNFRNYDKLNIEFDEGTNILYGDNAQGKTNILEAIYLSGTTKSHRSSVDKEMIKFLNDESHVRVNILKHDISYRIDMHLKKSRPKGIAINGVPIRKAGDLFGILNLVFFSPEDLNIIKDGPAQRRRFLNMELCQLNKIYFNKLAAYNKILKERNTLLKEIPYNRNLIDTLDVWDEQLVDYGTYIIEERRKFIEKLNVIISKIHANLSGNKEHLEVIYEPDTDIEFYKNKIIKNRESDIFKKTTGAGPHKDDMIFKIGDVDIRKYGSQGQQRTSALSLKLAEIQLVKDVINDTPILLLDDVLSELDSNRQNYLLNSIHDIQTVISCTGLDEFVKNRFKINKIFKVVEGKVISEN